MRIARELVSAVAYVHAVGWVHKTVRSSNIILARHESDPKNGLGHVNLIGFSYARRKDKKSTGLGVYDWKTEIYLHPERQRQAEPSDSDSETATLTEETMTEHLVASAQDHRKGQGSDEEYEYYREKHDVYSVGVVLLELGLWKDLVEFETELHRAGPKQRREALTDISARELPRLVGERYEHLVSRCLGVDIAGISAQEVLQELEELRF
jgi:serine/threonine protein kinase